MPGANLALIHKLNPDAAVPGYNGSFDAPYPAAQYYAEGHDAEVANQTSAQDVSVDNSLSYLDAFNQGIQSIVAGYQQTANQAALDQQKFNAAEAEKNRQFQLEMSNTAHQREMADLKAAGLNPVLTAMGGNGASTPSGSVASASQAETVNGLDSMTALVTQSMRDVQSAAQREMEMVMFDKSLSEEQRQFRIKEIHSAVKDSLYFVKDVAQLIMTGGFQSASLANQALDTFEQYNYGANGKLTSKYRSYVH